MTRIVCDCSVVAAILFKEPGSEELARRLDGTSMFAPPLLTFELASVARKKARRQPADAVAAYLKTRSVRADRVITVGAGEKHPVASNDTPDGRQLNRRVELTLVPLTEKS